jgi:hypothetical protein
LYKNIDFVNSNKIHSMIEDEEFDEEKYNKEQDELDRLFPDLGFSICIELEELDDIISREDRIMMKDTRTCYCYDECKESSVFIEIKNINGQITYRDLFQKLNNIKFKRSCNHHFFEGLQQCKNSNIQFEMCFGS